jgi:hypothetical protein
MKHSFQDLLIKIFTNGLKFVKIEEIEKATLEQQKFLLRNIVKLGMDGLQPEEMNELLQYLKKIN